MALLVYQDMLDAEIDRWGVVGIDKPIYYRGQRINTVKEYPDNLLMFRRKNLDPSYGDNYTVVHLVNETKVKVTKIAVRMSW